MIPSKSFSPGRVDSSSKLRQNPWYPMVGFLARKGLTFLEQNASQVQCSHRHSRQTWLEDLVDLVWSFQTSFQTSRPLKTVRSSQVFVPNGHASLPAMVCRTSAGPRWSGEVHGSYKTTTINCTKKFDSKSTTLQKKKQVHLSLLILYA